MFVLYQFFSPYIVCVVSPIPEFVSYLEFYLSNQGKYNLKILLNVCPLNSKLYFNMKIPRNIRVLSLIFGVYITSA